MVFVANDRFADRRDAGVKLGEAVKGLKLKDPVVVALPRGGVPVAFEVAQALGAPLEIILVRKIGAPGHSEYALGAIADGTEPQTVLNERAMEIVQPEAGYVEAEGQRQMAEIERRRKVYLGDRQRIDVGGRVVVLVDDGIATGSTARVALVALRRAGARLIILAVPVAPATAVEELKSVADDVVCLSMPEPFWAVGQGYIDFTQTSDEEVVRLLREASENAG